MNDNIIGGSDIRGTEAAGLTVDYAWNIGKALADWLPTSGGVVVSAVPSAEKLKSAIIEGLRLQGRNVVDGGTSGRDGVMTYIRTMGLSGGVNIGFDELQNENAIELFRENAIMIDSQAGLVELDELVQAGNFVPSVVKGELTAVA